MMKTTLAAVFFVLFLSGVLHAETFWKIRNKSASMHRQKIVVQAATKCASGVAGYFEKTPGSLELILFGNRKSFTEGLVSELGFSRKRAKYFSNSSAPRPIKGKLLVPPDMKKSNICHEMVHHYLEANTDRKNLLDAKWFDEGTASALAFRIFEMKKYPYLRKWFKTETKGRYIHPDSISTEKQWKKYHSSVPDRIRVYNQVNLMMGYFFRNYSGSKFTEILERMKHSGIKTAFIKTMGFSVDDFYRLWVKSVSY